MKEFVQKEDFIYERLIRPLLFLFEPESIHHFVHNNLKCFQYLLPDDTWQYSDADLSLDIFGQKFRNPIGLAAGFDKNGNLINSLDKLGFAFAEIGSVCGKPHGGNVQPRLFRLPEDKALVNRLGLNGLGASVVSENIFKELAKNLSKNDSFRLALNIAKTNDPALTGKLAVEDVVYSFSRLKELPFVFVTLNTSCPNTTEGCLQESAILKEQIQGINEVNNNKIPILLKLSPDSTEKFIEEVVEISIQHNVSGFVCGNTTLKRKGLQTEEVQIAKIGQGGLSGQPLKDLNISLCQKINNIKNKEQIIIGVGGITNGQDAFDYLKAGASLLEIYTSLVYRGPNTVKFICEELSAILQKEGIKLSELKDI